MQPTGPKEEEAMLTSSLRPYEGKDKGESSTEATKNEVCNESGTKTTLNTHLELSKEDGKTSANVGVVEIVYTSSNNGHDKSRYDEVSQSTNDDDSTFSFYNHICTDDRPGDSTLGHEEGVASSPCNEAWASGELPLETNSSSQEARMTEDQDSAAEFGGYPFVESMCDLGSSTDGLAPQHDRDVCTYEPHSLTGWRKVSEGKIKIALRQFDETHALVAKYCWRAIVARDGGEMSLPLWIFKHSERWCH